MLAESVTLVLQMAPIGSPSIEQMKFNIHWTESSLLAPKLYGQISPFQQFNLLHLDSRYLMQFQFENVAIIIATIASLLNTFLAKKTLEVTLTRIYQWLWVSVL